MSYYDTRGGGSNYYRPSLFGGFSFFPPVLKALLITNAVVWFVFDFFLAQFTLNGYPLFTALESYLALWPLGSAHGPGFFPWQLGTYMFLHGGFWHLFFNMLWLWMFGMELEHVWGSRKFLIFYLSCGLGAGVANLIVTTLLGQTAPVVGASGAIMGVLIAFGMLFPDRPIYLYFLLPIRAKYFVALVIGFDLFYGVTGTADGVAHFAHLGGAAMGFLFILADRNLIPVRSWFSWLRPRHDVTPDDTRWRYDDRHVQDAKFYDIHAGKPPRGKDEEVSQEEIDAILDKISKGGYQNLTEEEKRILNEASRKIH
jgi:membrane associated rhomboid family serine protease